MLRILYTIVIIVPKLLYIYIYIYIHTHIISITITMISITIPAPGARRRGRPRPPGPPRRALAADKWGQHEWGRCKSNAFWQIGEKGTPSKNMKFAVAPLVLTPFVPFREPHRSASADPAAIGPGPGPGPSSTGRSAALRVLDLFSNFKWLRSRGYLGELLG